MKLENLSPAKGSTKNNDRLGRGQGSGGGGTAKRGHKGAKSRSGYSSKRGFEGGQMPLQRRLPKFGFNNVNRIEYKAINLDTIQSLVDKTGTSNINLDFLRKNGLIAKFDLVKILGRGEFSAKINIESNAFSSSAVSIIEKLGGTTKVVSKHNQSITVTSNEETVKVEPVIVKNKVVSADSDDLKKIEGIGPKIADLLVNAGISTFVLLSEANPENLKEILTNATGNFGSHDPSTWPQQASLAANGKWDELKELQDRLSGGRPE